MAFIAPVFALGGGAFGNLALAALGIGIQLAAAYFFPQKVKGPRLESLKQQTSRYGDHLARVHGSARVAGAVVWLKNDQIDESENTDRKGSVGPVVTTYTYTADCAIAFAWNGPFAGIPRLWADDKLCYDNSAETLQAALNGDPIAGIGEAEGATFTIYLGTDDQEPNADIEADRGVGLVPAWPGRCYIVIKNFPLDEFGRRLPNFEAEIVKAGDDVTLGATPDAYAGVDTYGDYLVSLNAPVGADATLKIVSLPQNELLHTVDLNDEFNLAQVHITEAGQIIVSQVFNPGALYVVDAATGAATSFGPTIGGSFSFGGAQRVASYGSNVLIVNVNVGVVLSLATDPAEFSSFTGSQDNYILGHFSNFDLPDTLSIGPTYAYAICSSHGDLYMWEYVNATGAVTPTSVSPPSLTGTKVACHYHAATDSVIILTTDGLWQYDNELTTLINFRADDFAISGTVRPSASLRMELSDSTIMVQNGNDIWEYQVPGFALVQTILFTSTTWPSAGSNVTLVPNAQHRIIVASGTSGVRLWYLPRMARGSEPLADVIERECGYVSVPNDVTAITGDVRGYAVRDGSSPRGVIEDLMRVKFFDFAQSGGVLKFFMRSPTPAAALPLVDQGFTRDKPAPRFNSEEYPDIVELPAKVIIDYQDVDGNYRTGSQSVSRPEGMDGTTSTVQFSTSLAMLADEAAQAAEIAFNEIRDSSVTYRTSTTPAYLKYHPGDVLTMDLDETRSVNAVVTRMQGDMPLEMELRRRRTVYSSDAVGIPVTPNQDSILNNARAGLVLLDAHLARVADDDTEDSFYMAVYPAQAGRFNSATVFKSTDGGAVYSPFMGFPNGALVGRALSALPDRPHPWAWDRASSLTFAVASTRGVAGLPATVTEAVLLADPSLNAFAIRSASGEWEFVRAATVVNNGDGTWTISDLLRGRRGTEFAMPGHASGDLVVHLSVATIDRSPEPDVGLFRKYTAITTSKPFTATNAQSFRNTGKGLRPFSPVHVEGTRDGSDNLTITAVRRDRLGDSELVDDPPMSEASESYKCYVYDGSTLKRTITGSSLSFAYSAANQTTDFGSPQSSVDVRIVQVSAAYGDGVPATATV